MAGFTLIEVLIALIIMSVGMLGIAGLYVHSMQAGRTSDMIFSVAELVSHLSQDTTLLPGTLILTGTPPGVGFARKPPVFLSHGDRVRIEIERIGALENPVRAAAS